MDLELQGRQGGRARLVHATVAVLARHLSRWPGGLRTEHERGDLDDAHGRLRERRERLLLRQRERRGRRLIGRRRWRGRRRDVLAGAALRGLTVPGPRDSVWRLRARGAA